MVLLCMHAPWCDLPMGIGVVLGSVAVASLVVVLPEPGVAVSVVLGMFTVDTLGTVTVGIVVVLSTTVVVIDIVVVVLSPIVVVLSVVVAFSSAVVISGGSSATEEVVQKVVLSFRTVALNHKTNRNIH